MSDGPASQPPPSMGLQQRATPASEPPPPFVSPNAPQNEAPNYNNRREGTDPVRTRMVRSTPQMPRQRGVERSREPEPIVSDEDSSSDDFKYCRR